MFGNPFQPVMLPRRPRWRGDVALIEEAWLIYQKRRFEDLPQLADRLSQACYDCATLVDHFRLPGPHARGCWALDALLGRND